MVLKKLTLCFASIALLGSVVSRWAKQPDAVDSPSSVLRWGIVSPPWLASQATRALTMPELPREESGNRRMAGTS